MKKLFLLLFVAFQSIGASYAQTGLWTDSIEADANATFSGGSGTEYDPYLIATAADLAQIAVNINTQVTTYRYGYFRQTADIDLQGKYWIPIADGKESMDRSFRGHYDGDFHVVKNMTIKSSLCYTPRRGFIGLFAWMGSGSLKKLGVVDADVLIDNDRQEQSAILLGYADGAKVDRCFATGKITATAKEVELGPLVGQNFSNGNITNCYFIGEISAEKIKKVAGLVAYQRENVENCYVAATITTEAASQFYIANKNTNCFYDNTLNALTMSGQGTGKSTDEMKTSDMATLLGDAFTQDDNTNDGYPFIQGFAPDALLEAVGSAAMPEMRTQDGRITCNEDFRIYNLLGLDVTSHNGSLNGVYVVKTKNTTQKVVVK